MTGAQADESNLEDFLTRIPLFAEIDRVALAQLAAHLDPIVFEEGDTVCRQGEPGDCLYVLTAGRLGVHVHDPDGGASRRIDGLDAGDFFGEMALLTGEPRSATVRAEARSRVLRLERERFEALVREQPSSFLAIARGLSRRLASANRIRLVEEQALAAGVEAALERLPAERRQAVLEASLLEDPAELGVLFGDGAIATNLAALGIGRGGTVVRDVLRERLRRDEGPTGVRSRAEALAARLTAAGAWEASLGVLAAHADAQALGATLARALRALPPLTPDRARRWIERLDDAVLGDPNLALARAAFHDSRGDPARALEVLRRALGGALRAVDRDDGPRLAAEISRLSIAAGEHPVAGTGLRPRVTGVEAVTRRSSTATRGGSMATACIAQLIFQCQGLRSPIVARRDMPHTSSDGGLVLLKAVDERLRPTETVAASLTDSRQGGPLPARLGAAAGVWPGRGVPRRQRRRSPPCPRSGPSAIGTIDIPPSGSRPARSSARHRSTAQAASARRPRSPGLD